MERSMTDDEGRPADPEDLTPPDDGTAVAPTPDPAAAPVVPDAPTEVAAVVAAVVPAAVEPDAPDPIAAAPAEPIPLAAAAVTLAVAAAPIVAAPAVAAPPIIVAPPPPERGLLLRAVWFIFIGWWLSAVAIGVAYVACATIIGLPIGFWIFNRLPMVITLRNRTETMGTEVRDGVTYLVGHNVEQRRMWVRALYFIFIGWWLGAIYLTVAWALCVLILTIPFGLWMFNRVGAVMTLLRY